VALITWNPWWLLGVPISGPLGAAGHHIFRDGGISLRESTSSPEVVWFVSRMLWRILRGTYPSDIARARERLEALRAAPPAT
jgi:hypothetical protein